ncbi:MAG: hypothetical protein ACC628_27985 [Pirellulaceae bacterium]
MHSLDDLATKGLPEGESILEAELEIVISVLADLQLDNTLRANVKALRDQAKAALTKWDEWVGMASARVGMDVPEAISEKADTLVRLAYYAGLQSWLNHLACVDVEIGNTADLRLWCELQYDCLQLYPRAFGPGQLWPTLNVDGSKIDLMIEAANLLDCLVSGEGNRRQLAYEKLAQLPDLPWPKQNPVEPSTNLCECIVRKAWVYMRDLGVLRYPEPIRVRTAMDGNRRCAMLLQRVK